MTSRARRLTTVLLLAPLAFACGKKEEQPPAATQPGAPTPEVAATESPAVSAPARAAAPKAPVTRPATQEQAPLAPAAATPAPPPTTQAEKPAVTQPKGKITLPGRLGAVTFDHESHVGKRAVACTTCHHPTRPQKPLASENQACRDCHSMPAAPPMKTSLQAAFHDPKAATGTCIDCHKQKGGSAPVKCLDCHKKK